MICFRVSCYNLVGCKWCKLILVLHTSIWTNRSFHTDLQTQLSSGTSCTAEISLNSWVWDLICWSLPAFSPLCVLWARVCACLSDLCVSDPTRPFFHLMALSHLPNLFPDTLGISKAELSFLPFVHRLWLEIKTCLFWFFSLSVSCVSAGWSRRKSPTTMQNFPVTMAVWFAGWEQKHAHIPSSPAS